MKKIIFLGLVLVSIFVLSGCENLDISKISDRDLERVSEKLIVCNKPYMRYGADCCLDKDDNGICDRDERELSRIEQVAEQEISKEVKQEEPIKSLSKQTSEINFNRLEDELSKALLKTIKLTKTERRDVLAFDSIDYIDTKTVVVLEIRDLKRILSISEAKSLLQEQLTDLKDFGGKLKETDYSSGTTLESEDFDKSNRIIAIPYKTNRYWIIMYVGYTNEFYTEHKKQFTNIVNNIFEETVSEHIVVPIEEEDMLPTEKKEVKVTKEEIPEESVVLDLANYPSPFIKDNKFDGIIVVGDNPSQEAVTGATNIATALRWGFTEEIDVNKVKFASEVYDQREHNIISVGDACENEITEFYLDLLGKDCKTGMELGMGYIKLVPNGGNVALLVYGYVPINTQKASEVVANYQDYILEGNSMIVNYAGEDITVYSE